MKIQTIEQLKLKKAVKDSYSILRKDVIDNTDHYLNELNLFYSEGEKDPEYIYYNFRLNKFVYDELPEALLFAPTRKFFKESEYDINKRLILSYLKEARAAVNHMINYNVDAMILSSGIIPNEAFEPIMVFDGSDDSILMFARNEDYFNNVMINNYIKDYKYDKNLYLYTVSRFNGINPISNSIFKVYMTYAEKAYSVLSKEDEEFEFGITSQKYYDSIIENLTDQGLERIKIEINAEKIINESYEFIINSFLEAIDRYEENN